VYPLTDALQMARAPVREPPGRPMMTTNLVCDNTPLWLRIANKGVTYRDLAKTQADLSTGRFIDRSLYRRVNLGG
jgi:hypothetical protein